SGIAAMDPKKIFFLQLADAPSMEMGILPWSRHHRVFPGEGDFDLKYFMEQVAKSGYDGPVSLEIFNDKFREAEVARTAIDGLRSLIRSEEHTSELQSRFDLVCRLLLDKKKKHHKLQTTPIVR